MTSRIVLLNGKYLGENMYKLHISWRCFINNRMSCQIWLILSILIFVAQSFSHFLSTCELIFFSNIVIYSFYFRHFSSFDVANAFASFLRIAKFAAIFLKFSFIDFCSLGRDFRRFECLLFSSSREGPYQLANSTIRSGYGFSSFGIFMSCFVESL